MTFITASVALHVPAAEFQIADQHVNGIGEGVAIITVLVFRIVYFVMRRMGIGAIWFPKRKRREKRRWTAGLGRGRFFRRGGLWSSTRRQRFLRHAVGLRLRTRFYRRRFSLREIMVSGFAGGFDCDHRYYNHDDR